MDEATKNNIIIHWWNERENEFAYIARKYNVSIHSVKTIINENFENRKKCKHEFYEIDSWTGLKQCKYCDKLKS